MVINLLRKIIIFMMIWCGLWLQGCAYVLTKGFTYRNTYKLEPGKLQTKGYYYWESEYHKLVSAYIFFNNGYLYHGSYPSHEYIQKNKFDSLRMKEDKISWGCYRIEKDTIKIQGLDVKGNELVARWFVSNWYGIIRDSSRIDFGAKTGVNNKYLFYNMEIEPDSTNWLMGLKKLGKHRL
jgi:hypothetical protein